METVIHDIEASDSIEVSPDPGNGPDPAAAPVAGTPPTRQRPRGNAGHDGDSAEDADDDSADNDGGDGDGSSDAGGDTADERATYFSSSSDEDEDGAGVDPGGAVAAAGAAVAAAAATQSEWDRALRTGRSSEGKAEAAGFAVPAPAPPQQSPGLRTSASFASEASSTVGRGSTVSGGRSAASTTGASGGRRPLLPLPRGSGDGGIGRLARPHPDDSEVSSGVLPDVLMTVRQKIEASLLGLDSDMLRLADTGGGGGGGSDRAAAAAAAAPDGPLLHGGDDEDDPLLRESREALKRSSQQSLSAAILVGLAHKRYERRRLAAMDIEKIVRSLVQQGELGRVRAILLLLSDDYVRSSNEDARKGGVVALAACAIGLKRANDADPLVLECRDLILASVVHCCQCHSQRVRYYATESLFNVVKVMPSMAVQHFFILFEILRSLYADVDVDVRSGAELLDKKMKEVIIKAMNQGTDDFTAEDCIPVFARFVHMRNKATKRLTLTWLQELNEKLVSSSILEFLHLFLGGIFDMVADPSQAIRQSALAFLHSVLPKLLVADTSGTDSSLTVDFDQVLQSLVMTMKHPDPFVRKVAMYWMSRIVKAHLTKSDIESKPGEAVNVEGNNVREANNDGLSDAAISIRNSLPHILPGIFLSIGDDFQPSGSAKDFFLPDQSTRVLAEQTNQTLQEAVRRDGQSYVQLLDGFIVILLEELEMPNGLASRHPPAIDRVPYRMDVAQDGTGIESSGWFIASDDVKDRSDDSMIMSRLCALQWVIVLYENVVPTALKADYAQEFIYSVLHQLVDKPPETVVQKSLEVLSIITVPAEGEACNETTISAVSGSALTSDKASAGENPGFPMTESSISYAFNIIEQPQQRLFSRNREVFAALVKLHADNEELLGDVSSLLTFMCKMQPPAFVYVSFAVEIDRFMLASAPPVGPIPAVKLRFASSFIRHMCHVLFNTDEAKPLRDALQDCICFQTNSERDRQKSRVFHILLHSFSHNLASTLTLCFWVGAYRTALMFLNRVDPLDMNLIFFLEVDRFVEMLERPIFRHLHIRMLEPDTDPAREGSGSMLFNTLKSLLMVLPQSTCYFVLKDRLTTVSRFRQSTLDVRLTRNKVMDAVKIDASPFLDRILRVRALHCAAAWETIRADSLEVPMSPVGTVTEGSSRSEWLGYASKAEAVEAQENYHREKMGRVPVSVQQITEGYDDLANLIEDNTGSESPRRNLQDETKEPETEWKDYWEQQNVAL